MINILEISRKKGMVFKPSFKCLKNKKNQLYFDSKTRNFTLSEYIYIVLSYSIFIERFRLKQKKSGLIGKKHAK
jgi:hypothetical protein